MLSIGRLNRCWRRRRRRGQISRRRRWWHISWWRWWKAGRWRWWRRNTRVHHPTEMRVRVDKVAGAKVKKFKGICEAQATVARGSSKAASLTLQGQHIYILYEGIVSTNDAFINVTCDQIGSRDDIEWEVYCNRKSLLSSTRTEALYTPNMPMPVPCHMNLPRIATPCCMP